MKRSSLAGTWLFLIPIWAIGFAFAFGSPLSLDGDLWLHLKAGQSIWNSISSGHGLPLTDIFSYTAPGQPTEVHSWLGQWLFYLVYQWGGSIGLRLLHFILLMAVLGWLGNWVYVRTQSRHLVLLATALAMLVHSQTADLKPALFGEFCFVGILYALLGKLRPISNLRLLLIFIAGVFWINLHGSGLLIIPVCGLYALGLIAEVGDYASAFKILIVAIVSTLVNPRGWYVGPEAWHLAHMARTLGVTEWGGYATLGFTNAPAMAFSLLVLLAVSGLALGLWQLWHNQYSQVLGDLKDATFWTLLALMSMRHRIWLIGAITPVLIFWSRFWPPPNAKSEWRSALQLLGVSASCTLALCLAGAFRPGFAMPVPEKAVAFLAGSHLSGNVFNEQTWGGLIEFSTFPNLKVAIDARIGLHWPTAQLLVQSAQQTGMVDLKEVIDRLPETDIVIHRSYVPLKEILGTNWMVVFDNNVATVLLRQSERNQKNLAAVEAYYRKQNVPFDRQQGFKLDKTYQQSRAWFSFFQESMHQGVWPDGFTVARLKVRDFQFYQQRGLLAVANALMPLNP